MSEQSVGVGIGAFYQGQRLLNQFPYATSNFSVWSPNAGTPVQISPSATVDIKSNMRLIERGNAPLLPPSHPSYSSSQIFNKSNSGTVAEIERLKQKYGSRISDIKAEMYYKRSDIVPGNGKKNERLKGTPDYASS